MAEIVGTALNDVLLGTDGDDVIYGVDPWLRLISTDLDGTQGSNHSYDALISDDGRLVVFSSLSPDLPGAQTSGSVPDIYIKDIETGQEYYCSIETFDRLKGIIDRGFGRQYFLTLNHWKVNGTGQQLSLWEGLY